MRLYKSFSSAFQIYDFNLSAVGTSYNVLVQAIQELEHCFSITNFFFCQQALKIRQQVHLPSSSFYQKFIQLYIPSLYCSHSRNLRTTYCYSVSLRSFPVLKQTTAFKINQQFCASLTSVITVCRLWRIEILKLNCTVSKEYIVPAH